MAECTYELKLAEFVDLCKIKITLPILTQTFFYTGSNIFDHACRNPNVPVDTTDPASQHRVHSRQPQTPCVNDKYHTASLLQAHQPMVGQHIPSDKQLGKFHSRAGRPICDTPCSGRHNAWELNKIN